MHMESEIIGFEKSVYKPDREKNRIRKGTTRNRCRFEWTNQLLIKYDVCSYGTRILLIKQVVLAVHIIQRKF